MSHIEKNAAERERLRLLVETLSDEDLAQEVRDGWTVGAMLAHLALLDRLRLVGWERHLQTGQTKPERWFSLEVEQDMINNASQPLLLAIPPRDAAMEAIAAAEAVDLAIENLPPGLVQAYLATGDEHERRMLDRSIHRRKHLDEIEQFISRTAR